MKKYLLIFTLVFLFGNIAHAAVGNTFLRNILPETTGKYDLGSTTPALAWKNLFVNQICLTADSCRTTWPSGGAGSVGNWFTPFVGYNATSTTLGFLQGFFSTASSTIGAPLRLSTLSDGGLAVNTGLVYSAATTTFNSPLNYSAGAVTLSTAGTWSGNAGTATALFADGTNCSAGSYPLGVDASGNSQNCTVAATGGTSAFEIATTSTIATPDLAYYTKTSGRTTIGSVATTSLTASSPLSLSQPISVIGPSASALSIGTVGYANGGTGSTTAPQGQLLYGGATAYQSVATTSVTCTGGTTCTGFTVIGASPITINSTAGGGSSGGTWATTTSTVSGQLVNYSLNNTDIVAIGSNSTTTAKFYFDPNIPSFVLQGTAIGSTTAIVCKTTGQCQYNTISAAITAGERDIFVKDGTYSEKITMANTKTKLRAQSLLTIIQCNGTTQSPCVTLTDESVIDGFTFNETNAQLVGVAISASNHSLTKIINNRINNFATSTQYLDTTNTTFYNTNAFNTYFGTGTCWEFGGTQANANWISNNRCRPLSDVNGTYGAYVSDARGIAFNANDVEGTTTAKSSVGYYFDATSRDNTVTGGWDEALGTGVLIAAGANNISFSGTTISSHGTDITDSGTNSSFLAVNRTGTKLFQIPSLTIGSLAGMLKGTAGVVGVATAGTDYIAGGPGAATSTYTLTGPFNTPILPVVFASGALTSTYWGLSTTTALTSGQLLYNTTGGNGVSSVATTSIGCSGNISCTGFTALGAASTISFTGTLAIGSGGTGTTTAPSGQLLYGGGAGVYQSTATSSATCSGSVSCSGFTVVGSVSPTITSAALLSYDAWTHPAAGTSATTSQASTTQFSTGRVYVGLTATTTIDSTGNIVIPSGSSLTNTGVTNGCGTWASGVLGSTGVACGSGGGGTDPFTHAQQNQSATTSALGIGTTTPFSQLSVSSSTAGSALTSLFAIASDTNATLFNVLGSGRVGIGTTSPGSLLSVQGIANFTTGTSTFYATGGINITGGCFAINGVCLNNGVGGVETPSGTINSANLVFTTTYTPVALFLNGAYQTPGGVDYTLTGTGPYTETFVIAPPTSSILRSQYLSGAAAAGGGLTSYDAWTHAPSGISSATTSAIGIGTTTPWAQLSVSTSTQSAATTPLFAVASTTNATLFSVLGNGLVSIVNQLRIPYGTAPTLLANGDVGVDSTGNQFQFYSSGAVRTLSPELSRSFTYATSSWTGTTTIPLDSVINAYTFTKISCYTDIGTVNLQIGYGSASTTMINASTTNNINNYTTNNSMAIGSKVNVVIGTPASSPNKIVCTTAYTINAL